MDSRRPVTVLSRDVDAGVGAGVGAEASGAIAAGGFADGVGVEADDAGFSELLSGVA